MMDNVYVYKFESASLVLTKVDEKNFRLHNLRSVLLGQGHATGLLKIVTEWADNNGVDFHLTVQAYGRFGILTNYQLQEFYTNFGFVRTNTDRPIQMTRTSQGKPAL